MHEDGDDALVSDAIRGDVGALSALLTDSRDRLVAFIRQKIPAEAGRGLSADDVVQEAHGEVFRRITGFEPRGSGSFDRWVRAIALRRLQSQLRRHGAAKRGGGLRRWSEVGHFEDSAIALFEQLAGPQKSPSRCVARGEAARAVHDAIKALPDDYQRAVWLVHIEGRGAAGAAVEMGRTQRAVHGLCRRGLERLRRALGDPNRFFSSVAPERARDGPNAI